MVDHEFIPFKRIKFQGQPKSKGSDGFYIRVFEQIEEEFFLLSNAMGQVTAG